MSYAKHNMYVGKYRVPKSGEVQLPEARWRVGRAEVESFGLVVGATEGSELIAMTLEDGDFWPVISLLTRDEAAALAGQLAEAAGGVIQIAALIRGDDDGR